MGAAFVGLRNRGINPFSTGLGATLMLNLLITFTIPGISIGGHLGGIVGGAVAGWVVLAPRHVRVPNWATYAVPVAVMVVAVGRLRRRRPSRAVPSGHHVGRRRHVLTPRRHAAHQRPRWTTSSNGRRSGLAIGASGRSAG